MYAQTVSQNPVCNFLHTVSFMSKTRRILVSKKFLNRKDQVFDKDEWSYLEKRGPKLKIQDVMDVEDRNITFARKLEKPKTKFEDTKEGIRWALDAAGNTGQLIKYFNLSIENQKEQIENLKKAHDKFDREIAMLQSYKLEKIDFDKKSLAQMDIRQITELFNQLLLQKRITKTKLRNMKKELTSIENELQWQEKDIEYVRSHITARIFSGNESMILLDELEAIQTIKEELDMLSAKYDVEKLTNAIEVVISSKNFQ